MDRAEHCPPTSYGRAVAASRRWVDHKAELSSIRTMASTRFQAASSVPTMPVGTPRPAWTDRRRPMDGSVHCPHSSTSITASCHRTESEAGLSSDISVVAEYLDRMVTGDNSELGRMVTGDNSATSVPTMPMSEPTLVYANQTCLRHRPVHSALASIWYSMPSYQNGSDVVVHENDSRPPHPPHRPIPTAPYQGTYIKEVPPPELNLKTEDCHWGPNTSRTIEASV